jgi:hypothetical protein
MRRFVLGWKTLGCERKLDAHIVNYADDFVICTRPGTGPRVMSTMQSMMDRLRLTVNTTKTRLCRIPSEPFKFLGYQFSEQISWKTGKRYVTPSPAKVKVQAICEQISELTGSNWTWQNEEEVVRKLNQVLSGWANYFSLGYVTGAWQIVQQHACRRLRWWLQRKISKRGGRQSYPDMRLYEEYGLLNLTKSIRRKPLWAKGT